MNYCSIGIWKVHIFLGAFSILLRVYLLLLQAQAQTARGESTVKRCGISAGDVEYTVLQIKNSRVVQFPFPHIYVAKVFRDELYDCILGNIVDTTSTPEFYFNPYADYPQRYILNLKGRKHSVIRRAAIDNSKRNFWIEFGRLFGDHMVANELLSKFSETLEKRNVRNTTTRHHYQLQLTRDLRGYSIPPHTDTPQKLVTTLFYLPRKFDNVSKYGTQLLSVRSEQNFRNLSRKHNYNARGSHMPLKMWEEAVRSGALSVDYQAKFEPNSMIGFSPCVDAWHAVARVPKGKNTQIRRDTLQGFVKAPRLSPASLKLGSC
ncbi:hypothetical protein RI054_16g76390 [Pseudoscourfieldia marina]